MWKMWPLIVYLPILFIVWFLPISLLRTSILPGEKSLLWEKTQGRVVGHRLAGKDIGRGSYITGAMTLYVYEYSKKTYEGDLVRFADFNGRVGFLFDEEKYPSGKVVTVYVGPRHPEMSVIEPGIHGKILIFFCFLALLALICTLTLVGDLRHRYHASYL